MGGWGSCSAPPVPEEVHRQLEVQRRAATQAMRATAAVPVKQKPVSPVERSSYIQPMGQQIGDTTTCAPCQVFGRQGCRLHQDLDEKGEPVHSVMPLAAAAAEPKQGPLVDGNTMVATQIPAEVWAENAFRLVSNSGEPVGDDGQEPAMAKAAAAQPNVPVGKNEMATVMNATVALSAEALAAALLVDDTQQPPLDDDADSEDSLAPSSSKRRRHV